MDSEQEPYLDKLKQITNVPIDILRRDLEKIKNGQAVTDTEKKPENVLNSRENGNIKAIKFILGSLIYNKDYVNRKIDYIKLLPRFKDVIELAKKQIKISSYFDYFDVDNMPILKDSINLDFSQYQNANIYFDQCLWLIISTYLMDKQKELTNLFKTCENIEERQKIMLEINKINKQLKGKNLEDFYVR